MEHNGQERATCRSHRDADAVQFRGSLAPLRRSSHPETASGSHERFLCFHFNPKQQSEAFEKTTRISVRSSVGRPHFPPRRD